MRFLTSFRVFVTLIGLAAGLILSPASKAQSEIAPDHFDGTDSWEAAAHYQLVVSKSPRKGAASQTDRHTSGSRHAAAHRQAPNRCAVGSRHVNYSGQEQSGGAEFQKSSTDAVTKGTNRF
jgi:hypothetical protein